MRPLRTKRARTLVACVGLCLAACGGEAPGGVEVAGADGDALAELLEGRPGLPEGWAPTVGTASQTSCEDARPDALDAVLLDLLAGALDPEVVVASVVQVDDGERQGVAVGTFADGAFGDSLVWVRDGDALLPLDPATAERTPGATDTSRFVGDVVGGGPDDGVYAAGQDCSNALAGNSIPPPPEPPAELRDDLVDATPDPAAPGDVVEVTFSESYPRGIAWELVDADGVVRWWMTSDANGGEPAVVAAGTDGHGVLDVGIEGVGPDRVRLDAATEPGEYRLCTANAVDDVCASIRVGASG